MSYEVIAIPSFKRELKKLAKKFSSLKFDFAELIESLQQHPSQGTALGHNCYKIRMSITSKGKGKSGGARVITCLQVSETTVYLLSIYDKSDQDTITNKELKELIKHIPD